MKPSQFCFLLLTLVAICLLTSPVQACWLCRHHYNAYGYGHQGAVTRTTVGGAGGATLPGSEPIGNEAARREQYKAELGPIDLLELVIKTVGGDRDKVVLNAVRDMLDQPSAGGSGATADQASQRIDQLNSRISQIDTRVDKLESDVASLKELAKEHELRALLGEILNRLPPKTP